MHTYKNFEISNTIKKIQNHYPTSRLSSNIPLKNFGCTTFVHIHNHNQEKLDTRARKCVIYIYIYIYIYSPTQKMNKCFDSLSKKLFVTMEVIFLNQNLSLVTLIFRGKQMAKIHCFIIFSI